MQREKYLMKNLILFALGSVGTKLISFFLIPLYTNILTTSEYGTADFAFTICTILVPIITFNMAESVMRFSLDKGADRNQIISVGYVFCIICILLGSIAIPVSGIFKTVENYSLYIFLYSVTYGINQILISNLRGKEKVLQYSISNILHTFCIAVFNILFLVVMETGIDGYFIANIISNVVTIIYSAVVGELKGSVKNFSLNKILMKKMVKYSSAMIPDCLMWWVINSSDRIMVTAMEGADANGIYAISYKIPSLLSTFAVIFNQAWSYSAIREDESADREEYNNKIYDKMVKTLFLCTSGLLMIIKPLLSVYVHEDYYSAWKYTPFLFMAFMFTTLGMFVAASYTVNKDGKGFLVAAVLSAGTNVVLNFILIPVMGVTGAAVATLISYFVRFVFVTINTRKYIHIKVLQKKHIMGYIVLAFMCASVFLEGIVGQLILIAEFGIMVVLMKDYIIEAFGLVKKILVDKLGKKSA